MCNACSSGVEQRLRRNARRGHSDLVSAVSWQPIQPKHTSAWMNRSVEQMVLWDALRLIQYRKRRCPRWPRLPSVFVFLWRDRTLKEAEQPEFTLSGCNNPLFSLFSRYSAVYYCRSQYRWRVKNKLSIRVKAKSYTEVTCFHSAVLKRAEQRGMCSASPNGPIINGQPSESSWIIYNPPPPPPPPPCWAAQSEVPHFKQRGRRIRCVFLSAPSLFQASASPLISILL